MEYLVFRLYGAMASWGDIAVGEARHTGAYPTKSAIVGLLAAALGIKREEEERQVRLARACRIAVRLISPGLFMQDYHTTQVPDSVGKFRYRTRRDELILGRERLGTLLSTREYRCDMNAWVAVSLDGVDDWTMQELREALIKPRFHLYLGRKSCPLGAPLEPMIISTGSWKEAFAQYGCSEVSPDGYLQEDPHSTYYWEGSVADFDPALEATKVQSLTRYDQPLSRKRWQFVPRQEYTYSERGDG